MCFSSQGKDVFVRTALTWIGTGDDVAGRVMAIAVDLQGKGGTVSHII
jgi:hypothetical protein